jgi:signal recognition particle receptor subunit beta
VYLEDFLSNDSQGIGEMIIVGPPGSARNEFISALCKNAVLTDQDMIFGRMPISKDLLLFLYGVGYDGKNIDFAWDLIAPKALGCIVLFDWYSQQSLADAKKILDFLTYRFSFPLVVAADVRNDQFPVMEKYLEAGMSISKQARLCFFRSSDAASIRQAVISLLDMLIDNSQYL